MQKYSRLRCLLLVQGLVNYFGWSDSTYIIKVALQTLTLQGLQGTPCRSILTRKTLFLLQGTLFSLQGSCFHYRDIPVNPCTSLYRIDALLAGGSKGNGNYWPKSE